MCEEGLDLDVRCNINGMEKELQLKPEGADPICSGPQLTIPQPTNGQSVTRSKNSLYK